MECVIKVEALNEAYTLLRSCSVRTRPRIDYGTRISSSEIEEEWMKDQQTVLVTFDQCLPNNYSFC